MQIGEKRLNTPVSYTFLNVQAINILWCVDYEHFNLCMNAFFFFKIIFTKYFKCKCSVQLSRLLKTLLWIVSIIYRFVDCWILFAAPSELWRELWWRFQWMSYWMKRQCQHKYFSFVSFELNLNVIYHSSVIICHLTFNQENV